MKSQPKVEPMAILFADTRGYSGLKEAQLVVFFAKVLPKIEKILSKHHPVDSNSWGDAIIAFFKNPAEAARCALDICDLFRETKWRPLGLPKDLNIRVGIHYGAVFVGRDAIRKKSGIVGTEVNLAARIEPVVPPGFVYGTGDFVQELKTQKNKEIRYIFAGECELAKDWGKAPLYCIRWSREGGSIPKLGQIQRAKEQITTRDRLDERGFSLPEIVKRCRHDLLFVGWSCRGLFSVDKREYFLKLVRERRRIQFLIYDPAKIASCSLRFGPVCNVRGHYVRDDIRRAVREYQELVRYVRTHANLAAGRYRRFLELRQTDWLIAWSAMAIDRDKSDGALQIELYHYNNPYQIDGHLNKRAEILLTRRSEFYRGFKNSIDAMWRSARSLKIKS